jgi:hypothetical protein
MKNAKYLLGLAVLLTSNIVTGQDSSKNGKLLITGSVDAYYRYNFHNAKDSAHTNNYTSFTNSQNSFELGVMSGLRDFTQSFCHGCTENVYNFIKQLCPKRKQTNG